LSVRREPPEIACEVGFREYLQGGLYAQQFTVDRLFREPSIEDVRHMTATPERGPVVLLYDCTECNWIYSPQTPEEDIQKVSFDGSIQV